MPRANRNKKVEGKRSLKCYFCTLHIKTLQCGYTSSKIKQKWFLWQHQLKVKLLTIPESSWFS